MTRSVYAPSEVPPLFGGPGLARNDHPETAKAAAESIAPISGEQRRRVLACISERGCTDEEGIAATGISPSAYRPRRVELVDAGLVRDGGNRRRTASGRQAIVWEARP